MRRILVAALADGPRGALFGLHVRNPGAAARTVTVKVDAHSELLEAYPWGFADSVPNARDNLPSRTSPTRPSTPRTSRSAG